MGLYIGRQVGDDDRPTGDDVILDPDRLTQHAVCFGMTGSGKTGLCVCLLEELALAGVPVIVIDPKGDMSNLCLAFREHRPSDFEPWVDPAEAKRRGITTAELAAKTAELWRGGLAEWGVDADRIAAFQDRAAVSVYTPGSRQGIPIDLLGSVGAAPEGLDEDAVGELASATVSGLLALVGRSADPLTDPEHILLTQVLDAAWNRGESLSLETLILSLVDPPFEKVGVFPLDDFFPRKDRMKLAMQLNGVVASPAFEVWRQGMPIDVDALLTVEDKTPIHVFHLAHLDENQRMFFTSSLLDRIVSWSRRQPGTSSLRALVYFDEVFGYLPPHPKNPPTKTSVLTLMKQARAVGIGTMLVTQNPVDIDYKAISNAGQWFVGRLQTEQDQERVLDGLVASDGAVDRRQVASWLRGLPKRTFVVKHAKDRAPQRVHSRFAMSYLRGPLTLREIERLGQAMPATEKRATPTREGQSGPGVAAQEAESTAGFTERPPPAPTGYDYRFMRPEVAWSDGVRAVLGAFDEPRRSDGRLVWRAALRARIHLVFDEGRDFDDERTEHRFYFPLDGDPRLAGELELESRDLEDDVPEGLFAALPEELDQARELQAFKKDLLARIYRSETVTMYRHRGVRLVSQAGDTEAMFRARVQRALDSELAETLRTLQKKFDDKQRRVDQRLAKAVSDIQAAEGRASSQLMSEVVGAGETLVGMFFGRRRSVSRLVRQRGATTRANERVQTLRDRLVELEREKATLLVDCTEAIARAQQESSEKLEAIEAVEVGLEKNDITVDAFEIVWIPVSRPF